MEPPEKFPTPWLADSEWLLAELTKPRETIIRIPFRLENRSDIQMSARRTSKPNHDCFVASRLRLMCRRRSRISRFSLSGSDVD
jgi:hypothetical protein